MLVADCDIIWFSRGQFEICFILCFQIHIMISIIDRFVAVDIVSMRRSVEKSFIELQGGAKRGRVHRELDNEGKRFGPSDSRNWAFQD